MSTERNETRELEKQVKEALDRAEQAENDLHKAPIVSYMLVIVLGIAAGASMLIYAILSIIKILFGG